MKKRIKQGMLAGMVLLGMGGCGSDEVVVWLHLKNVTAEMATLQVSLTLDGKAATQQYEFTQGLGEVAIKLKKEQLGQGQLSVNLYGLRADRCRVLSGKYQATVSEDKPVAEVDVTLAALTPAQCPEGEVRPSLVKVPKGSFTMGSPPAESGRNTDEVQHTVTLTTDFWMAESEVTQRQYRNLMGSSPSSFKGDDLPVEGVSWFEAVAYCNALSVKEKLTPCYQINGTTVGWADGVKCTGYRLPTEAEWEYAANPATPPRTIYAGSDTPDGVAWHSGNAANTTHAVKTKSANGRGLYDLSGNVWEWVWDWYQATYEQLSSMDPIGPSTGAYRVFRGGSWYYPATSARVAMRSSVTPHVSQLLRRLSVCEVLPLAVLPSYPLQRRSRSGGEARNRVYARHPRVVDARGSERGSKSGHD
jgi:formylglycine-generating enzyme required for sulfatase activity